MIVIIILIVYIVFFILSYKSVRKQYINGFLEGDDVSLGIVLLTLIPIVNIFVYFIFEDFNMNWFFGIKKDK